MNYDAFISYSHAADGKLAPALQRALKSLAKPWYRLRALSVFRDETDLSAEPDLTAAIRRALAASRFFLYLGSPGAAGSRWVGEELLTWKRRNLPDRLLIAVTDGEIEWDNSARDFDWGKSTALHPNLKGVFSQEPLWVDLRWARSESALSSRDPRFQHATAMLASPMHGKSLSELVGEDVQQHRRTQWVAGMGIFMLVLLLLLSGFATFVAKRTSTNLQSKLALVESVLPFFGMDANSSEELPEESPLWRRAWVELRDIAFFPPKPETWVAWGPESLALRSDCLNPRQQDVGAMFDCPKHAEEFDNDGLRTDIPGLGAMVATLARALTDGRALGLIKESSFSEEDSADQDLEIGAQADLESLVGHAGILLPSRLRAGLPESLRPEERPDHFESRRSFEIWRQPILQAPVDSELIVLRLSDSGYCGSAGCSNPTVGFLRIGADYALVFVQAIWGGIAIYDAGPGNMPQIFSIGTSQSGVSQQYRTIARSIFDADCLCYRPYLTGRVTSFDRQGSQEVPNSLASAARSATLSLDAKPDKTPPILSKRDALSAMNREIDRQSVRIEDIEGDFDLQASTSPSTDPRWSFGKGRLEIQAISSNRVLILLACGWRDNPKASCWEWWTLEWRDGQFFGIEGRLAPLTGLRFVRKTRSVILEVGDDQGERLGVYKPAASSELSDSTLRRRLATARRSWSVTAKDGTFQQSTYSIPVRLIVDDPLTSKRP